MSLPASYLHSGTVGILLVSCSDLLDLFRFGFPCSHSSVGLLRFLVDFLPLSYCLPDGSSRFHSSFFRGNSFLRNIPLSRTRFGPVFHRPFAQVCSGFRPEGWDSSVAASVWKAVRLAGCLTLGLLHLHCGLRIFCVVWLLFMSTFALVRT